MEKLKSIFNAYYVELMAKVTWPKWEELQSNTFTVLIASLIIAFVIGLMDLAFSQVLTLVYNLFN